MLWSKSYVPVNTNIINSFIKDVFIEEKVLPGAGSTEDISTAKNPPLTKDQFTLKWASVKDLGLIFVVGTHDVLFYPSDELVTNRFSVGCLPVPTSFNLD